MASIKFTCFDTLPVCDGQTDGCTDSVATEAENMYYNSMFNHKTLCAAFKNVKLKTIYLNLLSTDAQ